MCWPIGGAFRGFDGERLDAVGFDEFASLLECLGTLADTLARGDDEHRQVVAAAVFGVENVIAEAQAVFAALAAEMECVHRGCGGGFEEMDRIAVALGLEELPQDAHLREAGSLLLHLFDQMI